MNTAPSTAHARLFYPRAFSSKQEASVISVLDVGSSKVACLIASLTPSNRSTVFRNRTHDVAILGCGVQRASGIKSGAIVDLKEAEKSIRLAIDAAEQMAGLTIESLIVNLSARHIHSEIVRTDMNPGNARVTASDIAQVITESSSRLLKGDRVLLHALPVNYVVDGSTGISDPKGMFASKISADVHVITAEAPPLRNLELLINSSHLEIDSVVVTPYASALSTVVDDEGELGVACVDIGGGTTSVSVLVGGRVVYTTSFPLGGQDVTMDLARGLSTGIADAERVKTLYGSALIMESADNEVIEIPCVVGTGIKETIDVSRRAVAKIIRQRVDEILGLVNDCLASSGFANQLDRRVVLTGGTSQLTGLVEVARQILGHDVRLGRPLGIHNLPQKAKGAAFAASVGLLIYPQVAYGENLTHNHANKNIISEEGYFSQFKRWIRSSW